MAESATNSQKLEEIRQKLNESLDKADFNSVKEHNTVFRQMAAQLILIAGIFLALSSQIATQLASSSGIVKLLTLIIITLLNLSILFGILQHMMEAEFFKKLTLGRRKIRKIIKENKPETYSQFLGASNQFSKMMGPGTKRWPTYVQLVFLASAMILISVTAGLKLFGI